MTEQKGKKRHIFCPYCDQEVMEADFPYCQACQVTIFYCPKCRKPLPRGRIGYALIVALRLRASVT